MAKPKASAVVTPQDELILTVDDNSWNDSMTKASPIPLSRKSGAEFEYPLNELELNVVAVPTNITSIKFEYLFGFPSQFYVARNRLGRRTPPW
jgi:hypothetical protein